ncbi:MAG: Sua5/YciO/YrdC/YwlC family protein [Metamycoplasmataceae bacterium]
MSENINDKIFLTTTDTVIGIGIPIGENNLDYLFKIKKREKSKKIVIAISSIEQLEKLEKLEKFHYDFINLYWPGNVTLIINENAYRIPNQKGLLELIDKIGPIYLTSANLSGHATCLELKDAKKIFPFINKIYNFGIGSNKESIIIDTKTGERLR